MRKPTVSAAILAAVAAVAAPASALADPTCAFGHWCAPGMFDAPRPPVSPRAKLVGRPRVSPRTKLARGIDRTQFLPELASHPELIRKMTHMVFGEVGRSAPLKVKIVQLETAFNRAQARGQSLAQVLLSVTEDPDAGYYAGVNAPAGGTYGPDAAPTPEEISTFAKEVLFTVITGSNLSDVGYGPMTGNASGKVAERQFAKGMPGFRLAGGNCYFREGPFLDPFPELSPASQAVLGLGGVKAERAP